MAGGQNITITIDADNRAGPAIDEVKKDFKGLAKDIADAMKRVNEDGVASLGKFFSSIKSVFGSVLGVVRGVAGAIGSVFSGVVGVVGGILGGLVDVAKAIVGGIISAFKFIPDALGLVFNKVTALGAAAFGFVAFKLGEAAAKSEAMGQALERLAKKAGTSSTAIVAAIKRGSGETITKLDAMRVANEALIAGLALTPEKFEELAAVADLLADAVGGDTSDAFGQLVQGIRAGNDRLLESVGIHIEAKQSYEAFAASVGKSVEDLTEAEKSQALLNAVLAEGSRLLKDAEGSADLLGDAYDRIAVLMKDGFTAAADAVRPALLSIAEALEPILLATKAWIDANQALITSGISGFAETLADGISRFANRLPEIVDLVGRGLSFAFDLAAKAGAIAWRVLTDGIGGAIREVEIFKEGFVGLLEGRGFSIEGSVLLQTFRVIKTQAKVAALEAAQAFTESFEGAAVAIANAAISVRNQFAELQLIATTAKNLGSEIADRATTDRWFGDMEAFARRQQARDAENAQAAIDATPRGPLTAADVRSGISKALPAAQAEADTELLRLGFVMEDVSARGDKVRAAASEAVGKLTGAVSEFFATDEERAAAQLAATEDANAAAVGAMQSAVKVTSAIVEEQRRARAEYDRARAAFEELLRQRGGATEYGGAQSVQAGG